jgi:small subunit ribosomal protein S6
MKKYEIMYIIDPATTEEQKAEVMTYVDNALKTAGAQDLATEKWGDRKLAYPINKKSTGFYVLTAFQAEGTNLTEVETKLNINENMMRYIIVKQG